MTKALLEFDPKNRVCGGKCPACLVPLRDIAHTERFAQTDEVEPLFTSNEAEAVGLCLIGGFEHSTDVHIGDSCTVLDAEFNQFATKVATRTAIRNITGVMARL